LREVFITRRRRRYRPDRSIDEFFEFISRSKCWCDCL